MSVGNRRNSYEIPLQIVHGVGDRAWMHVRRVGIGFKFTLILLDSGARFGMFWLRTLVLLWLLTPTLTWGVEPDAQTVKELIQKLKDPDAAIRGRSIQQLARIGPEARDAIPGLIAALEDKETFNGDFFAISIQTQAFLALENIGLEAIPELTTAVSSLKPDVSSHAIDCLATFGPRAKSSLDAMTKLLAQSDGINHFSVRVALSQIDMEGSIAVPILERHVSGSDPAIEDYDRGKAIELFGRYPKHPRTLPVLLAALKSPNPEVRGGAVEALRRIPGQSDQIVAALLPLLHDRELKSIYEESLFSVHIDKRSVMHFAARALAAQGASGEKVVPELLKELETPDPKDGDDSNVKGILHAIPKFQPIPPGTAARVFRVYERAVVKRREASKLAEFSEYDLYTELIAVLCLARMPVQTAEFTASWKTLFTSDDPYQRFEAAIILATIDPAHNQDAVAHVETVIGLATEQFGLDKIPPDLAEQRANLFPKGWADFMPQTAVLSLLSNPILVERFLPEMSEWTKKDLVEWDDPFLLANLKQLGSKAKSLGPVLLNESYRESCKAAFVLLGPDMVPFLIEEAQEELKCYQADPEAGYWTSSTALELLPHWPTAAVEAWPVILDFSHSSNPHYRAAALEAFGKIKGLHDDAQPELLKGLRDPRCIVRTAAARALGTFPYNREVIIPNLIAALQDDYADVRIAAIESLVKLGLNQPGVRAAIHQAKQDRHPSVKLLASEVLQ